MRVSTLLLFGLLGLVLAGCSALAATPDTVLPTDTPVPVTDTPVPATATSASVPSPTRAPTPDVALEDEPPPGGAELEFTTDWRKHSVSYSEILSGGPPKDGIAAVDEPRYERVAKADEWLKPDEPVILVEIDGEARAYPIQILMWHEIVNDMVGDVPVTVTYCPLCNTGVAFERMFDGQMLDFGTTGRLRYSNLIMYDRQTETWWQQATGEGIAGEYTGRQLTYVPASLISWADFKEAHPDGTVLSRQTGYTRSYGQNPYVGYDSRENSPFLYRGPDTPEILPAMARVVTVDMVTGTVAYPYDVLQELHVVNDTVADTPIVVLWAPGTSSALNALTVANGEDVGAATTFSRQMDGQTLTFSWDGERIVDDQTGSEWNVLGQAVSGPKKGSQLAPVVSINHFWFSWAAFRPETRVYGVDNSEVEVEAGDEGKAEDEVEGKVEVSQLQSDFEIEVYQGQDQLGGQTVMLSDVLAQGKPVVLNLWAGLCPTCRAELPHLQAAYDEYGDRVNFVAVDIGPFVRLGDKDDALTLLSDLSITIPAGATSQVQIMKDYRVLGTPATYFMKPDGEIVKQHNGILTGDQLSDTIEALIETSAG